MAWCPICRKEYDDGILCPDCSIELLSGTPDDFCDLFVFSNEEASLEIYNHLKDMNFQSVQYYYDDNEETYHIVCDMSEADDAQKQLVLYISESLQAELTSSERKVLSEITDMLIEPVEDETSSKSFVSAKDKYADMHSSAVSLFIVGFAGLLIIILDFFGIRIFRFNGFSRVIFLITMGVVFILFLTIGIFSSLKAKTLSKQIVKEGSMENDITDYIRNHITLSLTDTEDNDMSAEELYLERTAHISAVVKEKFPDADDSFIDHIIEELYDELYPCDEN